MSYLTRPLGLGFMLLMIIVAFQITTKKTLCMDSNIVYKIDNIISPNIESIYACSLHKPVKFSNFFYENADQLSSRLNRLDILFSQLGYESKIKISITPEMLKSDEFEKIILHSALERHLNSFDPVYIGVLTDFLSRTETSGTDLFTTAWHSSYEELSLAERLKLHRSVISKLSDSKNLPTGGTAEKLLALAESQNKFQNILTLRLRSFGVLETRMLLAEPFDFVFESQSTEFPLSELSAFAKDHPEKRVAFKNASGIFILPYLIKVPTEEESLLRAVYRFHIGDDKIKIGNYGKNSEHLVILNSELNLRLRPLFEGGAKEFLASNRQLKFVQFHMPSYMLVSKNLRKITDYFAFVKANAGDKPERGVLGWKLSEWVQERNAYKPIATFDAIQYYRVD